MVNVSFTKSEKDFLLHGVRHGLRGLDEEDYPEFRGKLASIRRKLLNAGAR